MVAKPDFGRRAKHSAREDQPAAGVVDPHQLLHDFRGRCDLQPRDTAFVGFQEPRERCLRRIGFRDIPRRDLRWQIAILGAAGVCLKDVARSLLGIEGFGHASTNLQSGEDSASRRGGWIPG